MTSYQPKKQPDSDELTVNIAFADLSSHLTKMGSIFEVGAKEIGDQVVSNFRSLTESERKDLDSQRAQLSRVNQTMEGTRKQLEQSWQKYVTAYRERQKAQEISVKVDQDMQLPRVEQQKVS
ncbi:unnamed protein product [Dicrocoelium dendriticum]|nr:unnamed protein product [Dicrocoelium dendriticum]